MAVSYTHLGCEELGNKVNDYLVKWRRESAHEHKNDVAFSGYEKENYLINASVPRFGSGEAKGILGAVSYTHLLFH